ncbi:MAG: FAD-binding protein, partial [Dehalococcoidia bacterium]|nr:FAD-binding protein [Dehalococcoidia bacterium]
PEGNVVKDVDVLVVGGGLAGCWAAIRAKEFTDKVVLADKAVVAMSGASPFTNQMLAPYPEGKLDEWKQEIVELGGYLGDQDWVDLLVTKQVERIKDLISWGVPFQKDAAGNFRTAVGRGHTKSVMYLLKGHALMETVKKHLLDVGVELNERVMITDLLTSDGQHPTQGRIVGAVGLNTRTGEPIVYRTNAVVIASGQMGCRMRVTYVHNLTGDGTAMAYRAGAELTGLEFCTRGNVSHFEKKYHFGGQSLFQGLGGRFINALGEPFVEKYDPILKNRAKLSLVCQAFVKEALEGRGPNYLDMRTFTEEDVATLWRVLPTVMKAFEGAGIDIRKRPVEVTPVLAMNSTSGDGGLRINTRCEASLPGLYGAGAATCNLAHGSGAVASINLAYCNVAGYIAGENAANYSKAAGSPKIDDRQLSAFKETVLAPTKRTAGIRPDDFFHKVHEIVLPARAIMVKNEKRIKEVLERLAQLDKELPNIQAVDAHDLVKANEARNITTMAQLIFRAALERKESRGWHYREEYPYRDDVEWLKWIVVKQGKGGAEVRLVPVPLEKFPLKPPERRQVPHPIQFSTLGEGRS